MKRQTGRCGMWSVSYTHLDVYKRQGVSRALLAQITRHRIASFSVQSQRYVSQANQTGSFPYILPPSIEALGPEAVAEYDRQMETMQKWYNQWQEMCIRDSGCAAAG